MNTPTPNLAYWRNREASKGYLLATTFSLTIVGYPVAAPFIQWLSPEGSGPAIILKIAIVALCALCFRVFYVRQRIGLSWLLPLSLFLLLYSLRLGENFFARDLTWQAEPIAVFRNFFGAGVLPALLLAPSLQEIDERALSNLNRFFYPDHSATRCCRTWRLILPPKGRELRSLLRAKGTMRQASFCLQLKWYLACKFGVSGHRVSAAKICLEEASTT